MLCQGTINLQVPVRQKPGPAHQFRNEPEQLPAPFPFGRAAR